METHFYTFTHMTIAVYLSSIVSVTRFPFMYHSRAYHLMQFIYLYIHSFIYLFLLISKPAT